MPEFEDEVSEKGKEEGPERLDLLRRADHRALPFARVLLVKALIMTEDAAGAVADCDQSHALESDQTDLVLTCGVALHRRGDPLASSALTRLQSMKPLPEPALAQWYAATGDLDRAFALLSRLKATRNLPPNLAVDPLSTALRADARYAEMAAG